MKNKKRGRLIIILIFLIGLICLSYVTANNISLINQIQNISIEANNTIIVTEPNQTLNCSSCEKNNSEEPIQIPINNSEPNNQTSEIIIKEITQIQDVKIEHNFVDPSADHETKGVHMKLIAAYNILGLDYAKSVQAIELTNVLEQPKSYTVVVSYPKDHSYFESLKISNTSLIEINPPSNFGELISDLKSTLKPTPQKDYFFKSYSFTLPANSTVNIVASITHDNVGSKKWFVHIIGSSGGTSLLYTSGKYKIYDVDGNIWWRKIIVNDTISTNTILDFPHFIDNADRVHPAKVQWFNDSNIISMGEKWGGVTDELKIDSTNNSEVNWKTPINLNAGDDLRLALGKMINFTEDGSIYDTKIGSVIANLSATPSNAVINITGSNQIVSYSFGDGGDGCTNTGGCCAGDSTNCCSGFELYEPGGGWCTCNSGISSYKAYNLSSFTCSQTCSSHNCGAGATCNHNSPSSNIISNIPGDVQYQCTGGGASVVRDDGGSSAHTGRIYFSGNADILFAAYNITFNITNSEIYSKYGTWILNNETYETTDFAGDLTTGINNLTFTSQTNGELYVYFNKQAENEAPNLTGIPDNSTDEDTDTPEDWIDLWPYANDDVNNDSELNFSVYSQTNTSLINCIIYIDRYLTCDIIGFNQSGYSNVTIKVTDTKSSSDTDIVRITVNPIDDAPYFTEIPDANVTENKPANISIDLWNYAYDNEDNDSQLNYSIISQSNASLINCSVIFDKFLTCAPSAENQIGESEINISVNDIEGLSDTDLIKITVIEFNDYPYFLINTYENSTLDNATIKGQDVNFTADIQDYDGDEVKLLICDSSGLFGESCVGTEFCSGPAVGTETVGLKSCIYNTSNTNMTSYFWTSFACDNTTKCVNGSTGTFYVANLRTLNLTVENTEQVWYYSGHMLASKDINDFSQELINAQSACTPDADGYCNISLDLESINEGIFEIYNIQIKYNISENRAPQIDSYIPLDLTPEVDEGDSLVFNHTSSDDDGDNITYNWTLDSVQQSTDTSWLYEPTYGDRGYYNVTLIVKDSSGLTDSQEWNVSVLFEDQSPISTLESPIDSYITASTTITFNCSATDDYQLTNITLYHNIGGTFEANQTQTISGISNSTIFTIDNILTGTYEWNCEIYDNNSQSSFANSNYTFTVTSMAYITLNLPINNSVESSSQEITFDYIVSDPANTVDNCSLFINDILNQTNNSITEGISQYFNLDMNDGDYNWKVGCYNNNSIQSNSTMYDLSIAYNNPPIVIDLTQNETEIYQDKMFEARCLVSDTETANNSLNVTIEYQHGGDEGWHYCEAEWDNSSDSWICEREVGHANYSIGLWDFRCNVSDGEKSSGWTTDTDTLNVVGIFGENKFYIKGNYNNTLANLDDNGNLELQGACTQQATCTTPSDSFIIKNSAGEVAAYIDSYGNLCIETGDCSDQSAECNPTNDAFIIQNSTGYNVSYIDTTGDLCLTGVLIEYGNP